MAISPMINHYNPYCYQHFTTSSPLLSPYCSLLTVIIFLIYTLLSTTTITPRPSENPWFLHHSWLYSLLLTTMIHIINHYNPYKNPWTFYESIHQLPSPPHLEAIHAGPWGAGPGGLQLDHHRATLMHHLPADANASPPSLGSTSVWVPVAAND